MDGVPLPRGTKRPADPYEFDDDPNAPVLHMDGLKTEADESGTPKVKADSLFTTEGLQPKLADLENLFDDHSDGDEPTVPTPPGSNKPNGGVAGDEPAALGGKLHGKTVLPATAMMNSMAELSKIYPTPPSHEHNHNPSASPVCHYEGAPAETEAAALAIFKTERPDDQRPQPPPEHMVRGYTWYVTVGLHVVRIGRRTASGRRRLPEYI